MGSADVYKYEYFVYFLNKIFIICIFSIHLGHPNTQMYFIQGFGED